MDPSTASLFRDILRREGRSLLQYIQECDPWTNAADQGELLELHEMIQEHTGALAGIARYLSRHQVQSPMLPPYPEPFTSTHFASLQYMLPMLIQHQIKSINQLERDLTCIFDSDARKPISNLFEIKKAHLGKMQTWQTATQKAAV